MGDYILRKMSVFYPNNLRFLCYDKPAGKIFQGPGDLKTVQVYTASPQTVQKLLEKYEIPEEPGCLKLWDILSDENPCELIHVEVEEENIFDLPELLSEAGIYFSGRRED